MHHRRCRRFGRFKKRQHELMLLLFKDLPCANFISVTHMHTRDWNCVRPGRSCFVRARSAWRSPRGSGNETASRQMLYSHYGLMLKRRWIHTVQACKVNPLLPNFQVCPYLAPVKDEVGFLSSVVHNLRPYAFRPKIHVSECVLMCMKLFAHTKQIL